jgi:nitrate reductase NapD
MMPSTRRAFFQGAWSSGRDWDQRPTDCAEIVSLIVSTWPERLDSVAQSILSLGNAEVHGRDPSGKLIVVLEGATQGIVGNLANAISGLPHVLSAVMVFQGTDSGEV